jgi:O-antigen/teichoic acid export membrane protein
MFAEMSNAQHGMRQFIEKALLSMYALLIPLAAVVVAFAPRIMAAFSPAYTTASNMLRLMAIFTLVGAANYISGSIIAWYRKTFYLTAANAVYAAVTIGYCYFAATDLTGLAVGWIWGEVANSILFVGGCVYFHKSALRKRRTHAV